MAKLIWTEEAFHDLDDITDFIIRGSAVYAQVVGEALIAASEQAAEAPYHGRMVPELQQGDIREKLVYSYRLIYKVTEPNVTVIAVVSGSQLLAPIVGMRL